MSVGGDHSTVCPTRQLVLDTPSIVRWELWARFDDCKSPTGCVLEQCGDEVPCCAHHMPSAGNPKGSLEARSYQLYQSHVAARYETKWSTDALLSKGLLVTETISHSTQPPHKHRVAAARSESCEAAAKLTPAPWLPPLPMSILSVAIAPLDPTKSPLLALRRHRVLFACCIARRCSPPAGVHVGELKREDQGPGPTACLLTVSLEGGARVDGAVGGVASSVTSQAVGKEVQEEVTSPPPRSNSPWGGITDPAAYKEAMSLAQVTSPQP